MALFDTPERPVDQRLYSRTGRWWIDIREKFVADGVVGVVFPNVRQEDRDLDDVREAAARRLEESGDSLKSDPRPSAPRKPAYFIS